MTGSRPRVARIFMLLGALLMLLGGVANRAGASGDGEDRFQDAPGFSVTAGRSFDGTNTAFTFVLSSQNGQPAGHIVLASCPEGRTPLGTTGPNGAQPASGNVADQSAGSGSHVGVKYSPGSLGQYTVVYAADVTSAQFIVKNGPGHRHFTIGPDCSTGVAATTSSTTTTEPPTTTTTEGNPALQLITTSTTEAPTTSTTAGDTTTTTAPEAAADATGSTETTDTTGPPADAGADGDVPTEVAGESLVTGESIARGATAPAGTLPATGSSPGSLLLLAGLATFLGGLAVRFGEPGPQQG